MATKRERIDELLGDDTALYADVGELTPIFVNKPDGG